MLVKLIRPVFTRVGFYEPDPEGTVMPDSLEEMVKGIKDAVILEGPDEANPVNDPDGDPNAGSFVSVITGKDKPKRRTQKAKPKISLD